MNSRDVPRDESASPSSHSRIALFVILVLAFLARLWKASGTFLNPDEALHALTAYQNSLAAAYKASLGLAHPPLFIIFLYYWHQVGFSELWLRLPSVIAGTVFCLFIFHWIKIVLGKNVAWIGFLFACFLPPMIELSAEVRQYAFLLCFISIAAYLLERAFQECNAWQLVLSFFFLYLAMLTHYSALLFVAALGIYSLLRLIREKPPFRVTAIWIVGQFVALGLFAFLYKTHISVQRGSDQAHRELTASLPNSFFHHGHDHLLSFVFARTFGTFQFLCSQLAIGDIAGLIFLIGVIFLFKAKSSEKQNGLRLFAVFLLLPYALNCIVACIDLYPYGGTRHSSFIVMFAISGISYALNQIFSQRRIWVIAATAIVIILCQILGSPHRPYMTRKNQSHANMIQAITAIKHQAAPGSLLFIDLQTNFLLQSYLCPSAVPDATSLPGFWTYMCEGYEVVSTTPDQSIFTPELLRQKWNEFTQTSAYHPQQPIWIFQAGWNIHLAENLQTPSAGLPPSQAIHPEFFGHNITLFRWM